MSSEKRTTKPPIPPEELTPRLVRQPPPPPPEAEASPAVRLAENAKIFLSAQDDMDTALHTIDRRQKWLEENKDDKTKSEDVRRVTATLNDYKEGYVGFLATYIEAVKLGVQTIRELSAFSEEDVHKLLQELKTQESEPLECLQYMVAEGSFALEARRVFSQARGYLSDFAASGQITQKNVDYCEQEMKRVEEMLKTSQSK